MRRIIDYVMQKLQSVCHDNTKVVQLLEILSALCTCKGVPVRQNQCKLITLWYPVSANHTCTYNLALFPLFFQ